MTTPAIRAENLGKKFLISHQQRERYTALRDVLTNKAKGLGRRIIDLGRSPVSRPSSKEEFWALKDVSFEVQPGERIGIIGRNGAGKSTLLKLLSRITEPSAGRIQLQGRIASLLEVGTGFHPELTGRENIFLNGAILGMSKEEIKRNFEEIVAFAEVEKFLDMPVKRFSSGMYVRLAFAVAAHLQTEILLVDEVLAVGDASFQKKSLDKMSEVSESGKTVLFVSHNMGAISGLCKRALLLREGRLAMDGTVEASIREYTRAWTEAANRILDFSDVKRLHRAGLGMRAVISKVEWLADGEAWRMSFPQMPKLAVEVVVGQPLPSLELGIALYNQGLVEIASSLSSDAMTLGALEPGTYRFLVDMAGLQLMPGTYAVGLGLKPEAAALVMEDYLPEAFYFEILESEESAKLRTYTRRGAILPAIKYSFGPAAPLEMRQAGSQVDECV